MFRVLVFRRSGVPAFRHSSVPCFSTSRNEASKDVFHSVEHNVATCSGSSGSPVIMIGLKEGKPVGNVFVPQFVPFLHFQGDSNAGDAASMQSIMPAIRKSLSQNNEDVPDAMPSCVG